MSDWEWEFSDLILALLAGAVLVGLGISLIPEERADSSARAAEPRFYEVHCEGPDGWEKFTVDFNAYGKPRSFRQGVMRFETTQGVMVHSSNCIAKHPAEWRR